MRCRKGDLAVVVRDLEAPLNVGRLVHVLGFGDCKDFYPCPTPPSGIEWVVRPVTKLIGWDDAFQLVDDVGDCLYPDDDLRPIRDPGDDARDESLSWLPVPSREEVSV